jgi:hypothetical protein
MLLPADSDDDADKRLFALVETPTDSPPWRPNLSPLALDYLQELGFEDAATTSEPARFLWMHVLATG